MARRRGKMAGYGRQCYELEREITRAIWPNTRKKVSFLPPSFLPRFSHPSPSHPLRSLPCISLLYFPSYLGDRIEWFRSREELRTWRDEKEKIHADFRNCLRGLLKMYHVWTEKANSSSGPSSTSYPHTMWSFGHAAYARRQAAMFSKLWHDCKKSYDKCNFGVVSAEEILSDLLTRQRAQVSADDKLEIEREVEKAAQMTRAMETLL